MQFTVGSSTPLDWLALPNEHPGLLHLDVRPPAIPAAPARYGLRAKTAITDVSALLGLRQTDLAGAAHPNAYDLCLSACPQLASWLARLKSK